MGKFTPGPWIPSKFGFQVLTGDSWNTVCSLKGAAQWEDGRGKYEQEYEWQQQEANANLIAAAPELYESLKEVFALLNEHEPVWYLQGHYKRMKAALEKAEGGE